jgi:hypothetical protein
MINKICIGLQVKYSTFLLNFHENWLSQHIFEIYSGTLVNENPSSGVRVFHADVKRYGQTHYK